MRPNYLQRLLPLTALAILPLANGFQPLANAASAASVEVAKSCGNGLLEMGETCSSCAADCAPKTCAAAAQRQRAVLSFTAPREAMAGDVRSFAPVAATLAVSYRTDLLHLPASGIDPVVGKRIERGDSASVTLIANDLDYGLRIVASDTKMLPARLATIEFDTCEGAPPPTESDLTCHVEACAGHGGPLADCYCKVTLSAPPASAATLE